MISSAYLKKSEIAEDIDYLDADEAFPDFPDDNDELESFDDLDFSDDPKGEEENTYVSMKDADDIAAQVKNFSAAFARKNITPLKSATEQLNETADDNAAAREELFEKLEKIEKQKDIAENFIEKFEGVTLEKIKNLNKEQLEIFKEEAEKNINNCQADSINLANFQMEAWMDRMIQIKLAEAYKQLDEYQAADKKIEERLEKIRLADLELLEREEKLLEEKKELIKEKEEIQQKIDEFDHKVEEIYRKQESKQEEIEGMIASLVEQNNILRDNLENEKKEKLQLKIVIEEQNKIIAAQTEQSEKLIITIKEENDQKAQILREKEELFDVIQKKDEKRSLEVKEYKEEIKKLQLSMIKREEKMEFNNSILIYLIVVFLIIWGFIGVISVPEMNSWLKSFVNVISWSSLVVGFVVGGFKIYRNVK